MLPKTRVINRPRKVIFQDLTPSFLRFICRVIVLLFLALLPFVSRSDYEDGKAAYKRGDYVRAGREFAEDARAGHARAQFALGLLHAAGLGVPRSDTESANWFVRAAKQGNPYAQYNLGLMRLLGAGIAKDEKDAVRWLREAAKGGLAQAQSDLGALHFYGQRREIEYPEAVSWLRKAAEQGHPLAQTNLACAYLTGGATAWQGIEGGPLTRSQGVTGTVFQKDEREAARWFLRAAEQAVVVAQFNLGLLHEKGLGVERNHAEAMKWYAKAVEAEFIPAFVNLAALYESGTDVARDRATAVQLRMRSARHGVHRPHQQPIVVMHLGIRTLRQIDGRKISFDHRKISTMGSGGGGVMFLFDPDLLVDPELESDAPQIRPGIGYHFHKPVDPRAPRLFEIASEHGYTVPYVKLMQVIARHAE